ncbi:MAG: TonB-dependent receptor [Sedimentisphaerales bacterium]|nr:TonB-dependent receptor [Sedimentisphaerales bacterium]
MISILALMLLGFFGGRSPFLAAAETAGPQATAESDRPEASELLNLSLEDLMNIEVTSVAGVEQSWFTTPAAMYVITAEDIRRSGHRSIAELLRMVPGLAVSQMDSRHWAITVRGFNTIFANKLLVLIDGRIVYDPIFAGTLWDLQDLLLEDIERIEVIRGPGATLWGANAVNGVINITTKSARDSQGGYWLGGAGTEERGFGAVRYGGKVNDQAHYRVWTKYFNRDNFQDPSGADRPDDWDFSHGGFRLDIEGQNDTALMLQGDMFYSDRMGEGTRVAVPGHLTWIGVDRDGRSAGGNVLFRLRQDNSATSDWTLQGYYNFGKTVAFAGLGVQRHTVDLDFRYHFRWGDFQEIVTGLAWHHTRDHTEAGAFAGFDPAIRTADTFSGFVQDTLTIAPDALFAMLGSKFEHNDYTGFEIQPSARLWWTPNPRQTIWTSVSRPVRTPSRAESDGDLTLAYVDVGLVSGGGPLGVYWPVKLQGNSDVESEELTAYELGYRVQLTNELSLDTAAFYNDYRKLITFSADEFGSFDNLASAKTYGLETAFTWRPYEQWKVVGSHSFFRYDIPQGHTVDVELSTPRNLFQVRSYLNLAQNLDVNAATYYTDNNPDDDAPAYLRFDLGVTWRPTKNLELSLVGQNLLDDSHYEMTNPLFLSAPTEVPRSMYGQLVYRF